MESWLLSFFLGCLVGAGVAWYFAGRPRWVRAGKLSSRKTKQRQYLPRGSADARLARQGHAAELLREVRCEDAIPWLRSTRLPPCCGVLTGVPDIHELDSMLSIEGYIDWFQTVVKLVLQAIPEDGRAIFMQTDVKVTRDGQHGRNASGGSYWQWLDKAHLALQAASQVPRARLLWHRVIFSGKLQAGGRSGFSAGYTHYLCFTTGDADEALDRGAFPDVIRKGLSTWTSGSGAHAVQLACSYLKAQGILTVVDPFCGEGSVLAIANALGLSSLGLEKSAKRARQAETLDGTALLQADREECE
ncbi:pks3, partial [Symbiodinium sp. CCMP2456]